MKFDNLQLGSICHMKGPTKGGIFQRVRFVFQISQSSKKLFQKTILKLKFKIPAHNIILFWAGILNFKFRIVFWNIFFGGWEIWKTNPTFWKKATFKWILTVVPSRREVDHRSIKICWTFWTRFQVFLEIGEFTEDITEAKRPSHLTY